MEWCNLRLNGIGYHAVFIPLLNRLVDIDYPYISDYPSYCIVNLGALAHSPFTREAKTEFSCSQYFY